MADVLAHPGVTPTVLPLAGRLEAHGCLHAAVIVDGGNRIWYPCRSHDGGFHHFTAWWPACEATWCRLPPEPRHFHVIPSGTIEYHDAIGLEDDDD